MLFDNCSVEQTGGTGGNADRRCDPGAGYLIDGAKAGARGSIVVRNSVIEHTATAGIHLINTAPHSNSPLIGNLSVTFENVQLRNVSTSSVCTQKVHDWFNRPKGAVTTFNQSTSPIMTTFVPSVGYACCAATFSNVSVLDTRDRAFMFVDTPGVCSNGWGCDVWYPFT